MPEDHLAWFVIEAVEELDLESFYARYRADGHGRPVTPGPIPAGPSRPPPAAERTA